jgi:hypothetical protein
MRDDDTKCHWRINTLDQFALSTMKGFNQFWHLLLVALMNSKKQFYHLVLI